jgi:hypothetical protein
MRPTRDKPIRLGDDPPRDRIPEPVRTPDSPHAIYVNGVKYVPADWLERCAGQRRTDAAPPCTCGHDEYCAARQEAAERAQDAILDLQSMNLDD